MAGSGLVDVDDSVLCVVDVQPWFLDRLGDEAGDRLVARIAWLCRVAGALGVPVVVTEEDPGQNDSTPAEISAALPPGTPVFEKPVFGLAAVPEILAGVEQHQRGTAVLVGLETDVCIAVRTVERSRAVKRSSELPVEAGLVL